MRQGRAAPVIIGPSGEEIRVGVRLGLLYLGQGHLDEAETVFEAVLASLPEEDQARTGLEEVRRRRRREQETLDSGVSVALARRKITRLQRYLAMLRRSATANL